MPDQHVCASCGTAISTTGGRCPMCGALQPESPQAGPISREAPSVSRRAPAPSPHVAFLLGGGLVVVGLVGLVAWKLTAPAPAAAAPASASATLATPSGSVQRPLRQATDPSRALLEATKRARAWNADARLVAYVADGVVEGRVDRHKGGRIEIVFAGPGRGGLTLGTRVANARYVVLFDASGVHTSVHRHGPPAWSVAPPACPLDVAWRSVIASGVPSSKPLGMRYAMDKNRGRAVWTATTRGQPGQTRTLDGRSCAILVF